MLQHRDFASAARAIYDACKNLLGAEGGYVALLSEDGTRNELAYLDAGGHPCAVDPALPMPVRGLRAEAYRLGEAVYHNDFQHSEWVRFLPPGHTGLQNVLFVPLVLDGKALGLLGLSNKAGGFGENDARMAAAFAELATIALRNSRALDSLTESEGRIRSVAQTASDAIIAVDGRGVIALWNSAAETIFGYASEEIIGQPLTRIMPAELRRWHDRAFDEETLCRALPHQGRTMEASGLHKDGHVFPIEISLSAWMAGSRPFFTAIIRDITERTRTEGVLRESEQRFRTLYETMSQGVVHQDAEGRIISANPAAQRILGMTLDELQGRTSADPQWRNIHEDGSDFPGEEHPIVLARKTGAPVRDVVMGTYFPRDGQYHWMKVDAVPQFRPGEERPYQVYAVFEDITERKRAQQEIESLARFPAENPSPVLRIRRDGVVLYANRAGKVLLDEWERELHSDGPAYWRALVASALDGRAARSVDTHCGGRVWSLVVVPVVDAGYANLYALDITGRVQAVDALRRAHDELESRVEERTAQLAALNAVSAAAASSLDLGEVMATLRRVLSERWEALGGIIYSYRSAEDRFALAADWGLPQAFVAALTSLPAGGFHGGQVAGGAQPICSPNYRRATPFASLDLGASLADDPACAFVPLAAKGELQGALCLFKLAPAVFDGEQITFLESLAQQVGVALQNARLYEQVRAGRRAVADAFPSPGRGAGGGAPGHRPRAA